MANFTPFKFTSVGLDLEYEAQAGKVLNFSKFVLGDGEYGGSIRDLTNLINPIREEPITRFEIVEIGAKKRIRIGFSLDTTQITEGFYLREIGLFAKDPDTGNDILMFYTNAGETADYISNNTSTTVTTKLINAEVYIDDVSEITATIDSSLVYALAKDTYNKTEVDEKIENINIKFEADIEEINDKLNYLDENKYNIPSKVVSGENVYIEDAYGSPLVSLIGEGKYKQVTTTGKQLYNIKNIFGTSAESILQTLQEDYITISFDNTNGTATKFINVFTSNLDLKTSTNYKVVAEIKNVSGSGILAITSSFSGGTYSSQVINDTTAAFANLKNNRVEVKTVTTKESFNNDTDAGIRSFVQFGAGESGSITFRLSVLEDTTITADTFKYEPYTGGQASPNPGYSQEIETVTEVKYKGTGKNLIDLMQINFTSAPIKLASSGCTLSDKNINSMVLTAVGAWSNVYLDFQENYFKVNEDIVVSSKFLETISGRTSQVGYTVYGSNDGLTYSTIKSDTAHEINYNVSTKISTSINVGTYKYIRLRIWTNATATSVTSGESVVNVSELMVARGTDDTYKPYQEATLPIDLQDNELCKVGDVADKLLIDRKGNVAIEKNVGKLIMNGSEEWGTGNAVTTGYKYFFFTGISEIPVSFDTLCDNLKVYTEGAMSNAISVNVSSIGLSKAATNNVRILFEQSILSDASTNTKALESFKAWLSENNTTLYYVLATPQIINLGKIENPEIFKGINNIVVETNLGNIPIEVEYSITDLDKRFSEIYKDISTINNNINEVNEKVNEISDKIKGDIPTKLSELENDTGFKSIEASTTDLEAGVSELATGKIYLVYE